MVLYIAIEGVDGSGKSTVARNTYQRLLEHNNQRDHIEIVSHNAFNLSSSYLAQTIGSRTSRVISYGEQKGSRVITGIGYILSLIPYIFAKREGKRKGIIISDRSPWVTGQIYVPKVSTKAAKVVMPLLKYFMEKPDYIFYLKVSGEVARQRVQEGGSGQLYLRSRDLEQLVAGYDTFMKNQDDSGVTVVPIETDHKTIDQVCEEATIFIDRELKSREQSFIQAMESISDEVWTSEYTGRFERVKDAFSASVGQKNIILTNRDYATASSAH